MTQELIGVQALLISLFLIFYFLYKIIKNEIGSRFTETELIFFKYEISKIGYDRFYLAHVRLNIKNLNSKNKSNLEKFVLRISKGDVLNNTPLIITSKKLTEVQAGSSKEVDLYFYKQLSEKQFSVIYDRNAKTEINVYHLYLENVIENIKIPQHCLKECTGLMPEYNKCPKIPEPLPQPSVQETKKPDIAHYPEKAFLANKRKKSKIHDEKLSEEEIRKKAKKILKSIIK